MTMPEHTHDKLQHFRCDVLPHPSYSPHLSPCDYHVFEPIKKAQKGLLWTQMYRKQSHHAFTDGYETSTDMVQTDLWNCGMSVSTTTGHMPNNLVTILMLCEVA
jgi:hypothetical protein